jgi:hypothetical protein
MPRRLLIILAILALILFVVGLLSLAAPARAQQFPQSPVGGQRLSGKDVTIHLQNNAAAAASRTREASGTDPLVRINDSPISITGTVSGFSSEGSGRWIILTRRGAPEAWVPLESIILIEVNTERR